MKTDAQSDDAVAPSPGGSSAGGDFGLAAPATLAGLVGAVGSAGAVDHSRRPGWELVGFGARMFFGKFAFAALHPFPASSGLPEAGRASGREAAAQVERSRRCLQIARRAAAQRGPAGEPLGRRHAAIAGAVAQLAAETFAMEAMALFAAASQAAPPATGLEAALAELWTTERSRAHADVTLAIVGRASADKARLPNLTKADSHFESVTAIFSPAESRAAEAEGFERSMAAGDDGAVAEDLRRLGEERAPSLLAGAAKDLRGVIGRAMCAPHAARLGPTLAAGASAKERGAAWRRAAGFYARWYPRQWLGPFADFSLLFSDLSPRLATQVRWTARASHRLARTLFHAVVLHGPARLEREELLLGRLVDVGAELTAIAAACSRAQQLRTPEALELADFFARSSRLKIARLFRELHEHLDRAGQRLGQGVLAGRHAWLEGS